MPGPYPSRAVPGGAQLCHRMFTRLGCQGRPPRFVVEFYPYANLVLTVRKRDDAVLVRFSDLLRAAPRVVLEAAAALLLGRLYRRPAPASLTSAYRAYARSASTRRRILRVRRSRARLHDSGSRGETFDLASLFAELNRRYFASRLTKPRIAWSARPWRRQFGCYDPGSNQILVNCRLDRPAVPQLAVEYVLFHEMLHVKHPTRRAGCSLVSHSTRFRREEKTFESYREARRILQRLV
jgi:Protein of unknown function DUF45